MLRYFHLYRLSSLVIFMCGKVCFCSCFGFISVFCVILHHLGVKFSMIGVSRGLKDRVGCLHLYCVHYSKVCLRPTILMGIRCVLHYAVHCATQHKKNLVWLQYLSEGEQKWRWTIKPLCHHCRVKEIFITKG